MKNLRESRVSPTLTVRRRFRPYTVPKIESTPPPRFGIVNPMINRGLSCGILVLIAVCCGGCILPVPHMRVHACGIKGQVVDAIDHSPISNAIITPVDNSPKVARSGTNGDFCLRPTRGWHAAYVIGPISLSILPGWDLTSPSRDVHVSAQGYEAKVFPIRGVRCGVAYLNAGQLELVPKSRFPGPQPDGSTNKSPTVAR